MTKTERNVAIGIGVLAVLGIGTAVLMSSKPAAATTSTTPSAGCVPATQLISGRLYQIQGPPGGINTNQDAQAVLNVLASQLGGSMILKGFTQTSQATLIQFVYSGPSAPVTVNNAVGTLLDCGVSS